MAVKMTVENSFHLFQGFRYDISNDEEQGPSFQVGDVDLDFEQRSCSSGTAKQVLEFLKGKGDQFPFLFLPSFHSVDGQKRYFAVVLKLNLMTQILNRVPDAFIRVVIKGALYPGTVSLNDYIVVDDRIPLMSAMRRTDSLDFDDDPNADIWVEYDKALPVRDALANHGECTISVSIGWEEPIIKSCSHSLLQRLFEDESTKDLVLIVGNRTELKCHRNIFSAHAEVFSAMLSAKTGMKEAQTGRVEMSENTEDGLRHLLRYIYGMELAMNDISIGTTVELFQTAHKYGLAELETALVEFFLEKGRSDLWFITAETVLELYLYLKNVEVLAHLRKHMLYLLASGCMRQLRSCELFKKLEPSVSQDVTFEIIQFFQSNYRAIGNGGEEEDGSSSSSSAKRRREN